MARVGGAEGELFEANRGRELGARLVARPEVEVEADVGVVAVLVVGGVLERQDVKGHHDAVDGNQDHLALRVHLRREAKCKL